MKHKKVKKGNAVVILTDILANLKAKRIIKDYRFWGMLAEKQIKVTLGKIKQGKEVDITYTITTHEQKLSLIQDSCAASKVSIIFSDTTKNDLADLIKDQLLIRINSILLEESFAKVLSELKADESISSFREAAKKERHDQGFHWLVIKNDQKYKVKIVGSKEAVINGKFPNVLYFDLRNSVNAKKDFKEALNRRTQQNLN